MKKVLTKKEEEELIKTLKERFENNINRHKNLIWNEIQIKIEGNPEKLWSLNEMEITEGEPDIIKIESENNYFFCDCAPESPKIRRSLCYDQEALDSRKENKPQGNVIDSANAMGIKLLTEEQYRLLQNFGKFDTKTSSWIKTPAEIRKLGGAIFCDFRYGKIFVYHNGAESYYASRGFRGMLEI